MNMQPLDWGIVVTLMAVLVWGAVTTKRYTRSVADFLAANRGGGRYLISVASSMAMVGVISLVWFFEINYEVGYVRYWWVLMQGPAFIVMAISGWVFYRYRQTRAMTLPQLFELRYSRNFRVFAGLVAFVAGIINFGIFPAVGARFFIAMCGLPTAFVVAGFSISTFVVLMLILLGTSVAFTLLGGQIAVMVTDFLQGVYCNIIFIAIIIFLLVTFSWDQISTVLLAAPAEKSLVHPFHIGQEEHFNFLYFVIDVLILFYGAASWQGTAGYNCAAKNAHEAKMAGILGQWRERVLLLIVLVVPICVLTFLEHPDFTDAATTVQDQLGAIESETLRNQTRAPLALGVLLPKGLLGLACAAMLAAFISTHDSYLHSWGSIFIQDVVLPFRERPFTPRQHLWLLRCSIIGVAVFIFAFSLFFTQTQYVSMFLAITGAIFMGGAGAVIIGGLYWKRGTTPAAWAAMITGCLLALLKVLVEQIELPTLLSGIDTPILGVGIAGVVLTKVNITGQEMTLISMVGSVTVYVLVSLLGPRTVFNMDKLLHRGKYKIAGDESVSLAEARTIWEKLGFSREFTGRDKLVTYITLGWPLVWTVIFVVVTAYNLVVDVPPESWLSFWHAYTWLVLVFAIGVTIWFTVGGYQDIRYLFRKLKSEAHDVTDDGRVSHEENDRVSPGRDE